MILSYLSLLSSSLSLYFVSSSGKQIIVCSWWASVIVGQSPTSVYFVPTLDFPLAVSSSPDPSPRSSVKSCLHTSLRAASDPD